MLDAHAETLHLELMTDNEPAAIDALMIVIRAGVEWPAARSSRGGRARGIQSEQKVCPEVEDLRWGRAPLPGFRPEPYPG